MLHGCGILNGKRGYLFVAPSEGGKSTIAKLALQAGMQVLNDDRIIIQKEKNGFKAHSNPWHGSVKQIANRPADIKYIFFLRKSSFNEIKPISKAEAAAELFQNSIYIPLNNAIMKKGFKLCCDLTQAINCYYLKFKPDPCIWRFLDGLAKY
jgi:hypothetical protein